MTIKESVFHKIAAMDHVGDANSLAGTDFGELSRAVSRPTNEIHVILDVGSATVPTTHNRKNNKGIN